MKKIMFSFIFAVILISNGLGKTVDMNSSSLDNQQ